ncbi:MAG: hypothetical protein EXR17_06805 [Flavobacteriaceae bacterium]|nr:hypothetical protein [Flavobacteriaceae bacterium]
MVKHGFYPGGRKTLMHQIKANLRLGIGHFHFFFQSLGLLGLLYSLDLRAQNDSNFSLLDEPAFVQWEKVQNSFKTTKVVNLQSLEMIDPGVFDFKMSHRFGAVNMGAAHAFGLDFATIRFGGEYGILPNLMVGLGRFNVQSEKGVDGYFKWRIMHQTTDNKRPLTVLLLGAMDYKNTHYSNLVGERMYLSSKQRFSFVGQLILGRKESEKFTWEIAPTLVHHLVNPNWFYDNKISNWQGGRNLPQTQFALGMGFRNKLTKRTSFNMEYIPILNGNGDFFSSFSLGFDFETGGHVFQMDFTNSIGLNESLFISRTSDQWGAAGVRFGFNLHRVFTVLDPSRFQ